MWKVDFVEWIHWLVDWQEIHHLQLLFGPSVIHHLLSKMQNTFWVSFSNVGICCFYQFYIIVHWIFWGFVENETDIFPDILVWHFIIQSLIMRKGSVHFNKAYSLFQRHLPQILGRHKAWIHKRSNNIKLHLKHMIHGCLENYRSRFIHLFISHYMSPNDNLTNAKMLCLPKLYKVVVFRV